MKKINIAMLPNRMIAGQIAVTQSKAARLLGITDRTLRRWDGLGIIKGHRVGGVKLYSVEQLRALVADPPA